MHANDRDGGQYGQVTYSILKRNDADLFRVSDTGDILTMKSFDYEDDQEPKVLDPLLLFHTRVLIHNGNDQQGFDWERMNLITKRLK